MRFKNLQNILMNLDGLSIGAAFTETFLKGASISLAIICEEFPHKIGTAMSNFISYLKTHVKMFELISNNF